MYLAGKTERDIAEELDITHETASNFLAKNGKYSEISQILSSTSGDEETQAKQVIIREHLGDHLLDPIQPPPLDEG